MKTNHDLQLLSKKWGERTVHAFMNVMRMSIQEEIKPLKDEVRSLDNDVKTISEKLTVIQSNYCTKEQVTAEKTEILKWMFVFWVGQLAALLGMVYLILHKG